MKLTSNLARKANRRHIGFLVCFAVLSLAPLARAQLAVLPQTTLQAGMQLIHAELATTPDQRETGLMYRRELSGNHGMLFIFSDDQPVCMWMKNTFIPLSVAFIDDQGRITNIADMKPQTLDSHCAVQNVRFALEMPLGWFAQRGLKPGFQLRGKPFGTTAAR
ncbi:conserved exported hypothetical protein [Thiomonas sp. X19]|uniref:DUF192 domain-containing protein n=1 Tax=Thiomonas sp. X19 TaxID=1050370 RepID=UPI000B6685D5|nr:DUF192 domain-containing protein [Thiomonas sp. X19]SCC94884.1 conserved exported hypothetical protein [Thiomonas sp. X19]